MIGISLPLCAMKPPKYANITEVCSNITKRMEAITTQLSNKKTLENDTEIQNKYKQLQNDQKNLDAAKSKNLSAVAAAHWQYLDNSLDSLESDLSIKEAQKLKGDLYFISHYINATPDKVYRGQPQDQNLSLKIGCTIDSSNNKKFQKNNRVLPVIDRLFVIANLKERIGNLENATITQIDPQIKQLQQIFEKLINCNQPSVDADSYHALDEQLRTLEQHFEITAKTISTLNYHEKPADKKDLYIIPKTKFDPIQIPDPISTDHLESEKNSKTRKLKTFTIQGLPWRKILPIGGCVVIAGGLAAYGTWKYVQHRKNKKKDKKKLTYKLKQLLRKFTKK